MCEEIIRVLAKNRAQYFCDTCGGILQDDEVKDALKRIYGEYKWKAMWLVFTRWITGVSSGGELTLTLDSLFLLPFLKKRKKRRGVPLR